MSIIFKIIGIAVSAAFLSIILKKEHKEYSIAISIAACAIILFLISNMLGAAISSIKAIADKSSLDSRYLLILLKVILIAYLSEYTATMLDDAGESAIAKKVEMSGKVIIFVLTLPILQELFQIILSIL